MATYPSFSPWNSYSNAEVEAPLKNFERAAPPSTFAGHTGRVLCLAWSSDGNRLASGSYDKTARVWTFERSTLQRDSLSLKGHTDSIDQLVWDPVHNSRLATCSRDKTVRIWDARTAKATQVIETSAGNLNIAWCPTGEWIAVGDKQDKIDIIDTKSWKIVNSYSVEAESNQLAWSVTGSLLFVCTGAGKVQVLSFPTLEKVHTFSAQTANIYCIDMDPRGRYFCVGGADALVSCWDTDDGVCFRTLSSLEWPVTNVSINHDGKVIAAGSEDHFVQLFDVDSGTSLAKVKTDLATYALSWHPSRNVLAIASDDKRRPGVIQIWNGDVSHAHASGTPRKTEPSRSNRPQLPLPPPPVNVNRRR